MAERGHHLLRALRLPGPVAHRTDAGSVRGDVRGLLCVIGDDRCNERRRRHDARVVVGKFYPPHRGHRHLIDVAASEMDRVSVFVVDGQDEDPPAETRAGWLRELHPDATVMVTRDIERDEDSVAWARATGEAVGGQTIDKVFDSEPYGPAWATADLRAAGERPRERVRRSRTRADLGNAGSVGPGSILGLHRCAGARSLRQACLHRRR